MFVNCVFHEPLNICVNQRQNISLRQIKWETELMMIMLTFCFHSNIQTSTVCEIVQFILDVVELVLWKFNMLISKVLQDFKFREN